MNEDYDNLAPELAEIFDEMSKRYVKAVRKGTGMRLSAEEVLALSCINWNTVENPEFDNE